MPSATKPTLALLLALALAGGCSEPLNASATRTRSDASRATDGTDDEDTEDSSSDDGPRVVDAGRAGSSRDAGSSPRDASVPAQGNTDDDASAPSADAPDAASDAPKGGSLPAVTSVEANGPYAVTIDQNVGPNRGWVVHPTDLGKDGVKHPIFIWGAGAGTNASNYRDHLSRWASHGFVVEGHASTGTEKDHKGALDWLTSENGRQGSPYYQKLDLSKVAFGGHSQGSISTFAAAADPRVTTTIHVAGGSFDGRGGSKLSKPTAYVCGASDTAATPNAERDYTGTTVPVFMTVMDGVDHIYAAREGLPPITAWLRWHLAGEVERKAQFIGPTCDFCKGKFVSKNKNW